MAQPGTDTRLQTILAKTGGQADFPAAAEIIQQLHAAVKRENCAALDVVRLILKDPGLSSKILRVVNSAYYRQQSDSISTVTKAVIILGFETIRDIATGLLLLEELIKRGHTSEFIREGLRRSLYCGLLAQALSSKVGYPTPEEAYLLGQHLEERLDVSRLGGAVGVVAQDVAEPEDRPHRVADGVVELPRAGGVGLRLGRGRGGLAHGVILPV